MRNNWMAGVILIVIAGVLDACSSGTAREAVVIAGGDSRRGSAAIIRYGCGSCHTISGIRSATGLVGPPLIGIRNRTYVAGILENRPDNLESWIRNPKSLNPKTAMPVLGVSAQDAADIAAYLYSVN
ncbi:MAG: c-type cytochrome [Acidobacteriia bacterium]|nr:c-type cytochrome [Terriglobia bacterium]